MPQYKLRNITNIT